jgi:hypothetical protein
MNGVAGTWEWDGRRGEWDGRRGEWDGRIGERAELRGSGVLGRIEHADRRAGIDLKSLYYSH